MSSAGNEHGGGFWPGYVDALVNVVLNLMFLAAILAIGSFAQGLQSARKTLQPTQDNQVASRAPARAVAPASGMPSGQQPRTQSADEGKRQLNMRFADDTVRLDDSAHERLKQELQIQMSQGVRSWQVSIDTDVDDNIQRRAAYLRMMSVRGVFLEVGIDANRFSLRMKPAAVTGVGQQVLHIVPEWQAPGSGSPAAPRNENAGDAPPEPEMQESRG